MAEGHVADAASTTVEQQLAVQYDIARLFAESDQLEEVAVPLLRALADAFDWRAAALWQVEEESDCVRVVAHYAATPGLSEWTKATSGLALPLGAGLPGRVWRFDRPMWVRDTDPEPEFPRRSAALASGLRHGVGVPVHVGGSVRAVIELFSTYVRDADARQTEFLEAIAHQLGSFIERTAARRAVATSEARKAAVLAAAVDAIVSSDANGRITEFNAAAEALFGWKKDEVVGRTIAEALVPGDLRGQHVAAFNSYLATGNARILGQRVRTSAQRRDGATVPVELTVTESRAGGDRLFTAFIRDITRERQAETARERFMEILSHELRTPVTAIYGGAKVLARPSMTEDRRRELIEDIGHEADRLHRLIENLIVLARAERGTLAVSLEPVHVPRVAQRVIAEFAGIPGAPPIELRDRSGAAAAQADETYVEQLLRNLVSNAVKYGEGRPVQVEISRTDREAIVRVLDRGRGIAASEVMRLFEIDYRSSLTDAMAQGSGIGLFVARWLTDAMNGRTWAAPREGGGSEFAFALPVVQSEPV